MRFRDQPVHIGPLTVRGHSGAAAVNENSGATRYREYGRYNNTTGTVNDRHRIPDLQFVDGVPTTRSVEGMLRAFLRIGEQAGSSDLQIEWDFDADYDQMVQFFENYGERGWLPWGPNCHTFCNDALRLSGGGQSPRLVRRLNRENVGEIARAIRDEYRRRSEEDREPTEENCRANPTQCNPGHVR